MSTGKVIRISDEAFSRLQNLAEPFIDTPSSVVEKLLDFYEERSIVKRRISEPERPRTQHYENQNLFLAPATQENFIKTISGSIALDDISHLLKDVEREILEHKAEDPRTLHCWAMTESNRANFNAMQEGDIVLFTLRNSGKFEYYGEVIYKTVNRALGNYLWDIVPGRPWELIYFLGNIKSVDIDKTRLVTELGYAKNFVVPGLTKVSAIKLDLILSRHSNIENFIKSVSR
jgi:hypothetical protein